MGYTIQTSVTGDFDDVVDTTIAALEDEGFGILCDIDVKTTLKEKLDVDVKQYRILGACNPPLAHDGLAEEPELGALLPCNVVVYEARDGDVVVSAVDPERLVGIADNPALTSIAADVHDRFERVLSTVTDQLGTVSNA